MSAVTDWPEVRVMATPANADAFEAWLFGAGALSVTYGDQLDEPILEPAPGEVRLWDHIILVGLFAQESEADELHIALHLCAEEQSLEVPPYQMQKLADTAWERTWMRDFAPMQFGPHLWICPSHCDPVDADAVNILLDPGLAFGTGTHATTAQCLNWLGRQSTHSAVPLENHSVIDYGCGSGVLGIAAALLGASQVLCVDIDEQAIQATERNARVNGVSARITTGLPKLALNRQADIVMANILYKPLLTLADTFSETVRPGGALVLSGVLESQVAELCMRYNIAFDFKPALTQDGWALLMATRRPKS